MIKWRLCDIGKFVQILPSDSSAVSGAVLINWTGPEYFLVTDVDARIRELEAKISFMRGEKIADAYGTAMNRIQALEAALRECLDCIGTLRNDYRMNSDTDELIARLTHSAKLLTSKETKGEQGS